MNETTKYEMFKFREDNRDGGIRENHVKFIMESIQKRNLLHLNPIIVNQNLEVLNGQHRLEAAKRLNVPIYYNMIENSQAKDIISLNMSKAWGIADYLNFYCVNGYPEYIKLKEFINKNKVSLKFALSLNIRNSPKEARKYKDGLFVFTVTLKDNVFDILNMSIDLIKKNIKNDMFLNSAKFQEALISIIIHDEFKLERWLSQLEKLSSRISIRVSSKDYIKLLCEIYNYRTAENERINLAD